MVRHFLGLYLLVVLTLAVTSWGQDAILRRYGTQDAGEDRAATLALAALRAGLARVPVAERAGYLRALPSIDGLRVELLAQRDVTGRGVLEKLARGEVAQLAGAGESWTLTQLDSDTILALHLAEPDGRRSPLEWSLTVFFYAAIALVLMIWIWPLRRDLRRLEAAASRYGDRNWTFDAQIPPRSQVRTLADTFQRMARRIDALIASHQDMTNAVAHEIRTPLSRMLFEIELARQAGSLEQVRVALDNLKSDLAGINDLVTATLEYAILERADVALNFGQHDFAALVPAIVSAVGADVRSDLELSCEVRPPADAVVCDAHLLETVLKNLLYNAARYARRRVQVSFEVRDGSNCLSVDDDGPGVPQADRERIFHSFVQLAPAPGPKSGFGLGLAIVRRLIEWHGGAASVSQSPLGGARFTVCWPASRAPLERTAT